MTECHLLSDRVIEVVHGGTPWTVAESEHLAQCAECRRELTLVQSATRLGSDLTFDPGRTAARVSARLAQPTPIMRFPVRRVARWAAVLAAAAILVLAVRMELGRREPSTAKATPEITLGELDGLTATELAAVLDEMPAVNQVTMPNGAVGMSDLSADELEQVLQAWGG